MCLKVEKWVLSIKLVVILMCEFRSLDKYRFPFYILACGFRWPTFPTNHTVALCVDKLLGCCKTHFQSIISALWIPNTPKQQGLWWRFFLFLALDVELPSPLQCLLSFEEATFCLEFSVSPFILNFPGTVHKASSRWSADGQIKSGKYRSWTKLPKLMRIS